MQLYNGEKNTDIYGREIEIKYTDPQKQRDYVKVVRFGQKLYWWIRRIGLFVLLYFILRWIGIL